jgi:2,3-dihydroxybenzoate-AMP ligase
MLAGCTPWPDEYAKRYRERGYWEGRTIPEALADSIAQRPGKIALVHGEERVTYAELGKRVERFARHFVRSGLKPLDRVVLQLHNVPEFCYAFFGLIRAGCIPVMALRAHRQTEVRHFIGASGAAGYVVPGVLRDLDYRAMAREMQAIFPGLRVFVAGEPLAEQRSLTPPEDRSAAELPPLDPSEAALMLLSGGTTSLSKLIPRTHDDYVYNAKQCGRHAGFGEDTVLMLLLPLGHNYNLASPGLMGALYHGGTVVLAPAGDPETVFSLIERERVTVVPAAVPLISAWLNSDAPERHDHSSLRVVQNGGARLAPELRARLRERLDCTPQEIYGTAEGLISMVRLDGDDEALLQSSGIPICDDDEIKVLGADERELADGESGELCVRGPYTMRGYYQAPEKNREAFTAEGFYRMGDIVRKRGRQLYTEGRRKDIINRGGEKISCDEIENYLFAHPKVKAATLVAMPDERFGEKACAFVIPRPGETLTFEELTAFLRARRIASFKLPERLEIVAEFPTSPVGKILKRELRERIAATLAREREEKRQ